MMGKVPNDERSSARVIHFTDCYDGGVSRAINDMVANSGHLEHILAFHGDETPPTDLYSQTFKVVGSGLTRMRHFRRILRRTDASVAHVHSSWAGGFLRLGRRPRLPLIYQPHCYKFADPTLSRVQAIGFRMLEWLLLPNTTVTVVLSPAERQAADDLGAAPVFEVPNVPSVPPGEVAPQGFALPRIVMVGRLSHQKDPEYFEQVVRHCRHLHPKIEAVWIGDGDERMRGMLSDAGVRVTGWLGAQDLADLLSEGGVYIHSARYEGLPLSVLDAVQCGLPVLLRSTASFVGVLETRQANTPAQLATEAVRLLRDRDAYQKAILQSRPWLEEHSDFEQNSRLRELYAVVLER